MSAIGRPGSDHRYVLLGLASGAPAWMPAVDLRLADLGSGHEFLPCAGIPDLLNRLDSGRPFSALLVDHRTVGVDRELISRAAVAGCPVFVVGGDVERWTGLGATAVIAPGLPLDELATLLARRARPIDRIDRLDLHRSREPADGTWSGRLVAVTGSAGAGAPTIARSLAGGLAADPRLRHSVCLVDARLEADQALLHGMDGAALTLQEATQAHRGGLPGADDLERFLPTPPGADHRLLPGIRRRRDWPTIGGPSLRATLGNLCRHHLVTVVDVDPWVDLASDEQPTGPATPGEPARVVCDLADLLLVVGRTGTRAGPGGPAALARTLDNLRDAGVPEERLVPLRLGDGSERIGRRRARRALNALGSERGRVSGGIDLPDPGADPVAAYGSRLARLLLARLDRLPDRIDIGGLVPITPGSLGRSTQVD